MRRTIKRSIWRRNTEATEVNKPDTKHTNKQETLQAAFHIPGKSLGGKTNINVKRGKKETEKKRYPDPATQEEKIGKGERKRKIMIG